MNSKRAAGLLMCRVRESVLQYFLVHPGGPFFKKKDTGVWSIPKGIPEGTEQLIETATREFLEETGIQPEGPYFELGAVKQKGGKVVHAWMFAGTWEPDNGIRCNTFTLEWPPRSGRRVEFPEVDTAGWFDYTTAAVMIIPEQIPFLKKAEELKSRLPEV